MGCALHGHAYPLISTETNRYISVYWEAAFSLYASTRCPAPPESVCLPHGAIITNQKRRDTDRSNPSISLLAPPACKLVLLALDSQLWGDQ
jgi:hypothetical protein